MHHALTPIGLNAIATGGTDTLIFVSQVCSNLAQSGASLAVAVRSKDSNMKQLASAAGVSALMGITEPALYGVTLKLKKTGCSSFHRSRNRWYRRRTSSGFSLHCTELYHGDPGVYR